MIVGVLILGGVAVAVLTANAFAGVLAIVAGLLAEETISDRRGNPAVVRTFYGIAAAVLALGALVLTVDALGGDPIFALVLALAAGLLAVAVWRLRIASRRLDRIVEGVAPR